MKNNTSDPYASSIIFQLILAFLTGIYALTKGINIPPTNLWGYFFISTLLYSFGTLSYFKALKIIGASESIILASIGGIVTIISAYFFLGERLTLIQIFGFILTLIAIGLISFEKRKINVRKGIIFSIIGTSLYGLAVTSDTYILYSFDAISYTPIMSLLPGILLFVLKPSSIYQIKKTLQSNVMKPLILYCLFYGIQAITYYLALENGGTASKMSIFTKSDIILTVILATIFLKERRNLSRKILATIIVSLGVYFLIS